MVYQGWQKVSLRCSVFKFCTLRAFKFCTLHVFKFYTLPEFRFSTQRMFIFHTLRRIQVFHSIAHSGSYFRIIAGSSFAHKRTVELLQV